VNDTGASSSSDTKSEQVAVAQFLDVIHGRAFKADVHAFWSAWDTGKIPTSVGAGVSLPPGVSWRALEERFQDGNKNEATAADQRYCEWRGKGKEKDRRMGRDFMYKIRPFIDYLEGAMQNNGGNTLARIQVEIEKNGGSINSYSKVLRKGT
jgi:hypothetical protein